MPSVLIVDDDLHIRNLLSEYLSGFGMQTTTASDGNEMEVLLAQNTFDLIILDLMLPGEDGLSLCRKLRTKSKVPILMLTARGEAMDRIVGLELGADDYIAKPFEPRELVARIQSILRRVEWANEIPEQPSEIFSFNGWRLHKTMRQLISAKGMVIPLSNAEFRLLTVFVDHPTRVLSREFLLDEARGRNMDLFDRSIDILVSRLRQKLEDDSRTPQLIKTIRGEGYMFDAKVIR